MANEFSNYLAFNQQQIIDNNIQFLKYNSSNKSKISGVIQSGLVPMDKATISGAVIASS